MKLETIPQWRRGWRLQWEPTQDCFVLLYPEGMVKLNETAGAILNQIDGERSVSSIIKNLEALYPEAGALEGDVLEFLSEAQQNGWLAKEA
ncbi:pyrroloquinoline quinone biosynthesis peptide chaperone PqqD [Vreelandella sulfidaeris]|uniref:PqqA binding protein n=1 Tax=Vreelandella sulfidaeris TaxID=115553 RepID=A0A365TT48_9GAMM|nr:pyrroloquinoline quinone biosynthesis peptide chaperone PqqD [Halomonas sulfidaeris]RBI69271.1 pyrroloquinoline quinone biosynthesis peptide chaperone PqqD [Halomonas sulfidaeris]